MLLNIFLYYTFLITQFTHTFRINNENNFESSKRNEMLHKEKSLRKFSNKDVANFDLADFISNDAEDNRPYDYGYKERSQASMKNDYSYLKDMDLGNKVGDRTGYKDKPAELSLDPSEYDDTMNNGNFDLDALSENRGIVPNEDESANKMRGHDNLLISRSDVHTTGKRCAFKEMRIPFFFHNKTTKNRKGKKRKICSKCKKNELTTSTKKLLTEKLKNKRSQDVKICPVCKSKLSLDFGTDLEKTVVTPKMIHNSRQYFAEVLKKDKSLPIDQEEYYNDPLNEGSRKKRDSNEENEILRELDEVQKKVDNVDINVPNFEKRNLSGIVGL